VLVRLQSPDQVLLPELSGILNYFDKKRGLPLNTAPLDGNIPGEKPSDLLLKLHQHWVCGEKEKHWGMDGNGKFVQFASSTGMPSISPAPIILPPHPENPHPTRRSYMTGFPVGLVIGVIIGFLIGVGYSHMPGKKQHNDERANGKFKMDNSQPQAPNNTPQDYNNAHNLGRPR
jgi:hypothetical protein